MANILISHFSPVRQGGQWQSVCMYDGLIQELRAQGNHVMQIISSDFVQRPWNGTNAWCWPFEKKPTIDTIKNFQPDLVIAFNNSMPEGIADAVACPIILWGADSFPFWNDRESLRKNVGRYHFFFYSERDVAECREFLKDSSAPISVVRNATAIRAVRQEKTYNLSFIGTNFALPVPVKRRCLTDSRELSRYIDHTMSAQERKNLHNRIFF